MCRLLTVEWSFRSRYLPGAYAKWLDWSVAGKVMLHLNYKSDLWILAGARQQHLHFWSLMNPSWWGKNAQTSFNYNRFKAVCLCWDVCIQSNIFVARVLHFSAFTIVALVPYIINFIVQCIFLSYIIIQWKLLTFLVDFIAVFFNHY